MRARGKFVGRVPNPRFIVDEKPDKKSDLEYEKLTAIQF